MYLTDLVFRNYNIFHVNSVLQKQTVGTTRSGIYRPDILSVARPIASKHWRETYLIAARAVNVNKPQSETADFVPGAATRRTRRNIRLVSDSGPFAVICDNIKSTTKPGSLQQKPRVTTVENLVQFGRVVFDICEQTDRQTDRQTDIQTRWSQYFTPLPGTK